jgi:diguanylate cyclase (GGDEF)-like protein/PAS domain S-box-containing protein
MTRPSDDYVSASAAHPSTDDRTAWALAASVAQDGLWYWDLSTNELRLSSRSREMLGREMDDPETNATALFQHVHAGDADVVRAAIDSLIAGKTQRIELEFRLLARGGNTRWTLLRGRSRRGDGQVSVVAGTLADIDQRKLAELQLREESRCDALTGLPNRAALTECLGARIARAAHTESCFAVLYLDLDRFKVINDSLGHAAGDELLTETAARLASCLGDDDLVARVGGDEFVIVLDQVVDEASTLAMAASLQTAMRPAVHLSGREVFTTISVGVRLSSGGVTKPSDLLRDADMAMYAAKKSGGARATLFDRRMHDEMLEHLRVQTELHGALHRGEFELVYQPIFDATDTRLCGFEALTRWNHPTRGRLTARDFVTDANETGLIVAIGHWVVHEACRQLADWIAGYPDSFPLSVSVNLCDREVVDPGFVQTIEHALETTGLPASRLVLEMSEGVMVSHSNAALPALRRLREQGVQVQMDNFGRGYSSLSTLRRMPLSAVKIDRSFVAGIGTDEEARAIVGTIAGFARALGLDVIAEGVETAEQAAALGEMGAVRFVQGNYFGRPLGSPTVGALLEDQAE